MQQCEIKVFERRGRKLLVDGFRHLSKQIALVTRIRVVEIIKNCDFKLSWRLENSTIIFEETSDI